MNFRTYEPLRVYIIFTGMRCELPQTSMLAQFLDRNLDVLEFIRKTVLHVKFNSEV